MSPIVHIYNAWSWLSEVSSSVWVHNQEGHAIGESEASGNRDWKSGRDVCTADRETGGREVVDARSPNKWLWIVGKRPGAGYGWVMVLVHPWWSWWLFTSLAAVDIITSIYHFYDKLQALACTPTSTLPNEFMKWESQATLWNTFHFFSTPSHNYFIAVLRYISLWFHSCLAFHFIVHPALFHCNFIPAWLFISFPTQPYFIAISFLPSLPFHCPPGIISLQFHSCLDFHFIAYLALFHCNFIPAWLFISLPT